MQMKKLRCDKPYDIDEARKKKGLPRRRRKDSRTTAYMPNTGIGIGKRYMSFLRAAAQASLVMIC